MTEAQATAFGRTILELSTSEQVSVYLTHFVRVVIRVANGQVLFSNDGDWIDVMLRMSSGERAQMTLHFNQLDDASVRDAVKYLDSLLANQSGSPEAIPEVTEPPPKPPVVPIWKESTLTAMHTMRETALPRIFDVLSASPFIGAGFLGLMARAQLTLDRAGTNSYYRETDSQCTVTARTPDGRTSGWAGQSARDWSRIDPTAIARRAVEFATIGLNPVALEPGRRTAILSPTAVAQLADGLGGGFAGSSGSNADRLGKQIFDARFNMSTDPTDPESGHVPFYVGADYAAQDVYAGLPLTPIQWVEKGRLLNLRFGVRAAAVHGVRYNRLPLSLRLEVAPGIPTATVEQMIAQCQEGIYVNRFAGVTGAGAGLLTGVTRDGCFLVKNGKIEKPLKNFRFLDSPFFMLNSVLAAGESVRADVRDTFGNQPSFPLVVPPLMVRDFNFSALSDAV